MSTTPYTPYTGSQLSEIDRATRELRGVLDKVVGAQVPGPIMVSAYSASDGQLRVFVNLSAAQMTVLSRSLRDSAPTDPGQ